MLQFFLVLEGYDCFSAKTFSLKNELDLAEKTKENINNDKTHLEKNCYFPTLYYQKLLKTTGKLQNHFQNCFMCFSVSNQYFTLNAVCKYRKSAVKIFLLIAVCSPNYSSGNYETFEYSLIKGWEFGE